MGRTRSTALTGYATELASALVAYGFDELALPVIRATTDVGNVSSVKVLEKLGSRLMQRQVVKGLDTLFFELEPPKASLGGTQP
jgi:RimJ/RimL family protein N-acetyltransferase